MLQTLFNVLLIILGFGVLIFIHELGHFIAAKWAGIRTEAFAVGMGPVAVAWRKGIGLRFRSTASEYERRVRAHLERERGRQLQTNEKVDGIDVAEGDLPRAAFYRIGDKLGLGETEYSLRWLPVGGFVKMLGQEDANPNYVSDDPRSYNMRPIGKRMVVVSAGVLMNLLLAVILFIIAFMIGVRFEAPVVGDVSTMLPAGRTMPDNAAALGITQPGLMPGDRVLLIDGDTAQTFADLQIASAMSKPGDTLGIVIERPGITQPLHFTLPPEKDPASGLRSIGVAPGSSTTLVSQRDDEVGYLTDLLEKTGLAAVGVTHGMTLASVNGRDVTAYGQVAQAARESNGQPLAVRWVGLNQQGQPTTAVEADLPVRPRFEEYRQREISGDSGIAGFSPLVRVKRVQSDSPNVDRIKPGDVFIRIADVPYPRTSQVFDTLKKHRRQDIEVLVLRNGEPVLLQCHVNKDGLLRVEIESANDLLITAQPVGRYSRYHVNDASKAEDVQTPAGRAGLFETGGTRVLSVGAQPVATWADLREGLLLATASALESGEGARIELEVQHPIVGSPREQITLDLTADEVTSLHALGWQIELPSFVFEPIYTTRQGSALPAIKMGFEETRKLVLMTYLTIDRLIRGSVGVDQLRGPVGIVHIGSKIADRGFTYLIFFLAMISVNLAVINFLPLPIVDGGLFLFLIYEKFKGRPPSLAFQNAATIVGLAIIGTIFVVTFYNDVMRLFT
jgi:regulator of sigma E protease